MMFKPQICLFINFYILLLQLFQQHLSQYSYKRLPIVSRLPPSNLAPDYVRNQLNAIFRLNYVTQYSTADFFYYASRCSCWFQSFSLPLYRNDSSIDSWLDWFVADWISLGALPGNRVSVWPVLSLLRTLHNQIALKIRKSVENGEDQSSGGRVFNNP